MSIDKSNVFDLLTNDPCCYQTIPEHLRLDREVARFLVFTNFSMIELLHNDLKNDGSFVVSLMISCNNYRVIELVGSMASLEYIFEQEDYVLDLALHYYIHLKYFKSSFMGNADFMVKLVTRRPMVLSVLDEKWFNNEEFIKKTILSDRSLFSVFAKKCNLKKSLILELLKIDGTLLLDTPRQYKSDFDCNMEAVKSNYAAAIYTHSDFFRSIVIFLLVLILNKLVSK